jgi:tRNA1Val (adenine37-N6)-methyltransferase
MDKIKSQAKSGFQFKQFFIEHTHCAMKVGTDSIMLGSWIDTQQAKTILDIGTGSGLLALMLAQKSLPETQLLGIDIDAAAIQQARQNALNCPWPHKLKFCQLALQGLAESAELTKQFDLIVSNPPYFAQNPKTNAQNQQSSDATRVVARQTAQLEHHDLIKYVNVHLSHNGYFYCVLPEQVSKEFIFVAQQHSLHVHKKLLVQSLPTAKITRTLLKFGRSEIYPQIKALTIYEQGTHYSEAYVSLCKAFYLRF